MTLNLYRAWASWSDIINSHVNEPQSYLSHDYGAFVSHDMNIIMDLKRSLREMRKHCQRESVRTNHTQAALLTLF